MELKIILKKILEMFFTLMLSTVILFTLIRLAPGDPVKLFLGDPEIAITNKEAYKERYEEMRAELSLDKPVVVQYKTWIGKLSRFDLGNSIYSRRPVSDELKKRIPATLILTIPALILQLIFGILFGIVSSIKKDKITDQIIRIICVVLSSIPVFALGLVLLYIFGVKLRIYDINNTAEISRVWLPSVSLALITSPSIIRIVRGNMLEELGKTYISFGLSRGLSKGMIIKNAFKNILLPFITLMAMSFTTSIGGAVVIENIFSWPGIGKYALDSILLHDYPVIQGYGFVIVAIIIISNFIVDIIYTLVNPKLRIKNRSIKNEV